MKLSDTVLSIAELAQDDVAVSRPAHIQKIMQTARIAGKTWAAVKVVERSKILAEFSRVLLSDIDSVCQTICRTTGKVHTDALLSEVYPVLDLARYYEKNAARILRTQGVPTVPFSFPFATAEIARRPYGVVAVISPWNYPFQITVSQIISALFAGNAVVFKLSELSIPVGKLIMDLFDRLDLPKNLVQCTIGDGKSGEQLIDAGPDLVVFTGSLTNGRAVMQCAAQHPIPVLLELGGKDAMIVFADAHLERACGGALYGAFVNSGQVCVSVERLYIEESCYPKFLQMLCDGIEKLKVGHDVEADLGAMTSKRQIEIVKKHYQDALAKGAKASGPLINEGDYLNPVVLWDVRPDMLVMQEETFGPLMPVLSFSDENEAIRLANTGEFSLNASIWSRDISKAQRIAAQLEVGNWSINDVLKNVGHPGLPFGGIKKSGFGRYHGAEGLRSFTYTVSGLTNRSQLAKEPNWFPYSETSYQQFKSFMGFVFGTGTFLSRVRKNWQTLKVLRKYSTINLQQRWHNLLLLLPWNREF